MGLVRTKTISDDSSIEMSLEIVAPMHEREIGKELPTIAPSIESAYKMALHYREKG